MVVKGRYDFCVVFCVIFIVEVMVVIIVMDVFVRYFGFKILS